MRMLLAAAVACATLALASGCGGSGAQPAPTAAGEAATMAAAPATVAAGGTASPSPAAVASPRTQAAPGATIEVTGIVGSVARAAGLIEIDRLSGAAVRRIAVDANTELRRAGGGTLSLSLLHPSQRIIARGTLNDRGDTLLASQVTVQDVLPNAAPGG